MEKNQNLYLFLLFLLIQEQVFLRVLAKNGFVKVHGIRFILNGEPFYGYGFNAYWLMDMASNPTERYKVTSAFRQAINCNLTIARTLAFNDGGSNALQSSPGVYNEKMFQGLDFVIAEAQKFGVKLILSLSNNFDAYGGKPQYVRWARERGQDIPNDDGFFTNPRIKEFYKNHVKTILTRVNIVTGRAYKNDPTIMAWELMNEPRCLSDHSGNSLHAWIAEMVAYVKSIDKHHLLEVGSEGFYGPSSLEKNPNHAVMGNDFIRNNKIQAIDFATAHAYTDPWLMDPITLAHQDNEVEIEFLKRWINEHIKDSQHVLKKPVLFTEFGKSLKDPGYSLSQRDEFMNVIFSEVYKSASTGGAAAGLMFWQQQVEGMESFRDGFEINLSERSTTTSLITQQANQMNLVRSDSSKRNKQRGRKDLEDKIL